MEYRNTNLDNMQKYLINTKNMSLKKIIGSDGNVYNSITKLAKVVHKRRNTISKFLKQGNFEHGGIKYHYEEEGEKEVSVSELVDKRNNDFELKSCKKTIKKLVDEVSLLKSRQGIIEYLSNVHICEIKKPKNTSNHSDNTAVTLFSDVHWENKIEPGKVNYLNEYNPEIAAKRCENYFIRLCELIEEEQCHRKVSTLVIGFLGDFINAWLREEAMQTNYKAPLIALGEVKAMIIRGLRYVKANTKLDRIVCSMLVANHGRNTNKIQHGNITETNLEYMVYCDIKQNAELYGLGEIEIRVPKGALDFVKVYDYNIAFQHGHVGFKYQGGVGGIFIPLNKYFSNLNNRERVDYLCIGHYHQLTYTPKIVVNGSVCGIDSYAYNLNLPYERPQQALFFINSKYGRTKTLPIFCD